MPTYRVMHPWDPAKCRRGTLKSEHATITEAFAAIDAMRGGHGKEESEWGAYDHRRRMPAVAPPLPRGLRATLTGDDRSGGLGLADYWARQLQPFGHQVRPRTNVRPYVRRNKTDRTDAKGLALRMAGHPRGPGTCAFA